METKSLNFEQMEDVQGGFNGCHAALGGAAFIWGAALTAATGGAAAFFLGAAWSLGSSAAISYVCGE
jgi:hypothetical protein